MSTLLLRIAAVAGPAASWLCIFLAVIAAVFVLYLGIALLAAIYAPTPEKQRARYEVFCALLSVFQRRTLHCKCCPCCPGRRA